MRKTETLVILCLIFLTPWGSSAKDPRLRYKDIGPVRQTASISDRGWNILDVNLLGMYVSNMGQYYSSWQEDAPEGEWPLGSTHEQIYRKNVFVGVPGNVVQTRTYGEKEWDPVSGHVDTTVKLIPVSNDTISWPVDETELHYWPVQDDTGRAVIVSQQDSYGVYRDATNYLYITSGDPSYLLNLEVHQTSYAWNTEDYKDFIYFKYDVINDSDIPKDSVYFSIYLDVDAGGYDDYEDDFVGFEIERQFMYFYDGDNWSNTWNDLPFHMGLVFLETPDYKGITDFHYLEYYDEPSSIDNDFEQFGLMSSDSLLWADSLNWPGLFFGEDIHYDDVSLIPSEGKDLVSFTSSGPYFVEAHDTLTFLTALAAGADYQDLSNNVDTLWAVYNNNFQVKSVPQPIVYGTPGDGENTLEWDDMLDDSLYYDPYKFPDYENSILAYKIYKSKTIDPKNIEWGDAVDTIFVGDYSSPGLYQWIDGDVTNGFYYYYSVTAYDDVGSECGIANLEHLINSVELRPGWGAQTSVGQVNVVPNPFVISARWERERLGGLDEGEPIRELAFTNLPATCTIKIYTLDGDHVVTMRHSDGTGTQYWNLRTTYNQLVATGVYFYHIKSDEGEHVGKFAVIR